MAIVILLALAGCQHSYALEKLATLGGSLRVLSTDETGAPTGWVSGDLAYRWTGETGLGRGASEGAVPEGAVPRGRGARDEQ